MPLIRPVAPTEFEAYAAVSSAFTVASILECHPASQGLGGLTLHEQPVTPPTQKDYDGEGPREWAQRFDLTRWGLFLATEDSTPVGVLVGTPVGPALGAAAVAPPTPDMWAIQNRDNAAVLWDIRVAPAARGRGIATALFRTCADWARERGHRTLVIETQNTNVPACRFYAQAGCELAEIRRFAYEKFPDVAHEAMLVWQLAL